MMPSIPLAPWFSLTCLAEGVFAAIARPRYKVNSNSAILIGDRKVAVVDTQATPSAAHALACTVRELTSRPVRYVINTHFHWDHWQGNQVYPELFPEVEIISSHWTLSNLTRPNAGHGGMPFVEGQLKALPQEEDALRADLDQSPDPLTRTCTAAHLQEVRWYRAELASLQPTLPTRTIDQELDL